MLFYRAALDLSPATRTFVAELIAGHRDRIGSRWRALKPGRQALLVLVHLRCNETFARLAAAFGVGIATAHRYVTEVIALLADLREALRIAAHKASSSWTAPWPPSTGYQGRATGCTTAASTTGTG